MQANLINIVRKFTSKTLAKSLGKSVKCSILFCSVNIGAIFFSEPTEGISFLIGAILPIQDSTA